MTDQRARWRGQNTEYCLYECCRNIFPIAGFRTTHPKRPNHNVCQLKPERSLPSTVCNLVFSAFEEICPKTPLLSVPILQPMGSPPVATSRLVADIFQEKFTIKNLAIALFATGLSLRRKVTANNLPGTSLFMARAVALVRKHRNTNTPQERERRSSELHDQMMQVH